MNNIKNAITGIKGQFVSLKWHKTCSTYKNVTENIEKETQGIGSQEFSLGFCQGDGVV